MLNVVYIGTRLLLMTQRPINIAHYFFLFLNLYFYNRFMAALL
jgi:hypothetical protein